MKDITAGKGQEIQVMCIYREKYTCNTYHNQSFLKDPEGQDEITEVEELIPKIKDPNRV